MTKKELTIYEFRAIIKEGVANFKRRMVLENEKKALELELKELVEAKFDLEIPEVEEFLNKVKLENPEELSRLRSIIKNKGLESAKERYKQIDPEVIAQRRIGLSKEKSKETRKRWYEKNKEKIKQQKALNIQRRKQADEEDAELLMHQLDIPRKQKELARKFVAFLPEDFPQQVEKLIPKYTNAYDSAYYMLIGAYDKKFEDSTSIIIDFDNEYFEEAFEEMMYGRFGEEIEF